ncbi:MAG: hypothetical protein LT102_11360 [Burkholderiaceae bacterium]|nr:hypothetical protein [Burkholderiaceae bacterium]
MRTAALMLSCLVGAFVVAPAAAEDFHRVVAGLNYRIAHGAHGGLAQAVRSSPSTGKILVRYANTKTEWVDAQRLSAQPQPLATEAGPYLFVAAALACLLDTSGCVRAAGSPTTQTVAPPPRRAPMVRNRDKFTPVLATSATRPPN